MKEKKILTSFSRQLYGTIIDIIALFLSGLLLLIQSSPFLSAQQVKECFKVVERLSAQCSLYLLSALYGI